MLSASRPSRPTTSRAASTIRSRDSFPGFAASVALIRVQCSVRRTRREAEMAEHVAGIPENGARGGSGDGRTESAAGLRLGPAPIRQLAWLAIAGQVAFVAAWVIAGALEPGYSAFDQAISELGARNAAHPWLMNTGFVILGLAIAALGPCLLAVLPRRRAARVAGGLFAVAGLAMAL